MTKIVALCLVLALMVCTSSDAQELPRGYLRVFTDNVETSFTSETNTYNGLKVQFKIDEDTKRTENNKFPAFDGKRVFVYFGKDGDVAKIIRSELKAQGVYVVDKLEESEIKLSIGGIIFFQNNKVDISDLIVNEDAGIANTYSTNNALITQHLNKTALSSASVDEGFRAGYKTGNPVFGLGVAMFGILLDKTLIGIDKAFPNDNENGGCKNSCRTLATLTFRIDDVNGTHLRIVKPFVLDSQPRIAEVLDAGFEEAFKDFPTPVAKINLTQLVREAEQRAAEANASQAPVEESQVQPEEVAPATP